LSGVIPEHWRNRANRDSRPRSNATAPRLAPVAEIVITRPDERWANRLRAYKVHVDGNVAATLGRGEEARVTVSGGRHRIRATLDWGSSPSLDLELGENDRAHVVCRSGFEPSLARPKALLYITVWRKRYLDLQLLHIDRAA
jgi:hypothetical protein